MEAEDQTNMLEEDQAKILLTNWLEQGGWSVESAMGHVHGADIIALKNGKKWIIEVKGCGSRQPMRVNYFQAVLGEELQRMDDEETHYSIAVPDMDQYEKLWANLPSLAKQRTQISILFVDETGKVVEKK
jgi:hypothetical protein